MQKGNSRLPGDLLGRWTRLVEGLETITQGRWEEGFHIDMSDLVVLNAFLTEDAEFAKWQGGTWNATPAADPEGVVWEDVEYNDIVSDAQRSFELRVVIDQSEKQNKAVHIHIRKRVLGELAHVGIATLADGYRLQKRRPHAQRDSQEVQGE